MEEEFYIPEEELTTSMKAIRLYFKKFGRYIPKFTAWFFLHLFTTPRKRKANPHHQKWLDENSNSKLFTEPKYGGSYVVHYFTKREPQILICHGWESRTTDFRQLIEKLSEQGHAVASIDFPGHGAAAKQKAHLPLFTEVIKHCLKHYSSITHLIGHSLGAASITVALTEYVHSKDYNTILLGLHPVPSAFIEQYKEITQIDDKTYKKCVHYAEKKLNTSISNYNSYAHLDKFKSHHLILVHDVNDKVISYKRAFQFHDALPNSELYIGNHGGHYKHYKHKDVINIIISNITIKQDS